MQVPEKLALIGGSILLSSTLVFTLKSQASSIIPKVGHSIGDVYQGITDTQAQHGALSFDEAYQQAQKKNDWQTGTWGTSKYYIDDQGNLHIGRGRLEGNLLHGIGEHNDHHIKSINLDEKIQAPQDSTELLASTRGYQDNDYTLTSIHGLDNLDTSQVHNMYYMFGNSMALNHIDISGWDTSQVTNMTAMFVSDTSLSDLNVSGLNVSNVTGLDHALFNIPVTKLDLSSWHNQQNANTYAMFEKDSNLADLSIPNLNSTKDNTGNIFGGDRNSGISDNSSLRRLVLGNNIYLSNTSGLASNTWQSGNSTLSSAQLQDSNSHPGTWLR